MDNTNNNYTIKSIPKEERPREKLLKYGAESLTNSELVAILLGTGSKKENVILLAQKILSENNLGLKNIADATTQKLTAHYGISDAKAAKIMAVAEISKRISAFKLEKIKISSPNDAAVIMMEEMRYYKKEHFKIMLLDNKNNILKISEISIGTINSSIVHPRDIFSEAVVNNSASIILFHNHPSGEINPSDEDVLMTERLVECGKIMGIEILDHIIIGDGIFFSFKEDGYI